jgi:hypothetical protein
MSAVNNAQATTMEGEADAGGGSKIKVKYTALAPAQIQEYIDNTRSRIATSGLNPMHYGTAFGNLRRIQRSTTMLPHERNEALQTAALDFGQQIDRDIQAHKVGNVSGRNRVARMRRDASIWDQQQRLGVLEGAGLGNSPEALDLQASIAQSAGINPTDRVQTAEAKETARRASLGGRRATAHQKRGWKEEDRLEDLAAHRQRIADTLHNAETNIATLERGNHQPGSQAARNLAAQRTTRDALRDEFRNVQDKIGDLTGLRGSTRAEDHRAFDSSADRLLEKRGEIAKMERETARINQEIVDEGLRGDGGMGRAQRLSVAFSARSIGGRISGMAGSLMSANGDTFAGALVGGGLKTLTGSATDYSMNRFLTAETAGGQRRWGMALGASMGLDAIASMITAGISKGIELQRTATDKRTGEHAGYLTSLGGMSTGYAMSDSGFYSHRDMLDRQKEVDAERGAIQRAEEQAFERYNRGGLVSKTEALGGMKSLAAAGLSGGAFSRAMGAGGSFESQYDMLSRVAYHNVGVAKLTGFDPAALATLSQMQAGGLGVGLYDAKRNTSAAEMLGGLVNHGFATRPGANALIANWTSGLADNYTAHGESDASFLGNMGRRGIDPSRTGRPMGFLQGARKAAGELFSESSGAMASAMLQLEASRHVSRPEDIPGYIRDKMGLAESNKALQAAGPGIYEFFAKTGMGLRGSDVDKMRGADDSFIKDAGLETSIPSLLFSSFFENRAEIRKDKYAMDAGKEADSDRINRKLEATADALADVAKALGNLVM